MVVLSVSIKSEFEALRVNVPLDGESVGPSTWAVVFPSSVRSLPINNEAVEDVRALCLPVDSRDRPPILNPIAEIRS
jgi:hypothetical protein